MFEWVVVHIVIYFGNRNLEELKVGIDLKILLSNSGFILIVLNYDQQLM